MIFFLALIGMAAASGYEQDIITHSGINKQACYNSNDCAHDEVCERVCFWQQHTKQFVGCKITCVKKYPAVAANGHYDLLPLPVPKPDYHPPAAPHHAAPPPPPAHHVVEHAPPPAPHHPAPHHPAPAPVYAEHHATACKTTYECGSGQVCGYDGVCKCQPGFAPDKLFPSRCLNVLPHQEPQYPAHPTPATVYKPAPAAVGYRPCASAGDCHYGEKCCAWRACNHYGNCAVKKQCAKSCNH